eukprot:scaffold84472_cov60-Phaeocystis_antarctica.AAC.1
MQSAKPAVSVCASSFERLGDDNPAMIMLTPTRHGTVVPVRTCKLLRVFPRGLRVRNDYFVSPARVLTAVLCFLPPASPAACPTGWTPSPASANCFLVPPERSTSLFRC